VNRRHSKNHPAVRYARQQRNAQRIARAEMWLGFAILATSIVNVAWLADNNAPGYISISHLVASVIAYLALTMDDK
jgi:hypothetical protein